jgi:hypothetical protein
MATKKNTAPRNSLTNFEQYKKDVETIKSLALVTSCEGLQHGPEDVLEMLLIFGKYDNDDREEMLMLIAMEIYPHSVEGSSAIDLFIKRAKRKIGVR